MRRRLSAAAEGLALACALSAMAALLIWGDVLWRTDRVLYDRMVRTLQREPAANIVIVAIDERSLRSLGGWPWSRDVHARLVDQLTRAGAAVVGLDILFADPSEVDPGGDALLAEALERNGRVVLPVTFGALETGGQIVEILPLPDLVNAAAALGHADFEPDEDGIVRAVYLKAGIGEPFWPTLALAMLERLEPAAGGLVQGERAGRETDRSPFVWVRDQRILLPFVGPAGSFEQVSFVDVLRGRVASDRLRGRYALVGVTAPGLGGRIPTPTSSTGRLMTGVEFDANVLDVLLRDLAIESLEPAWMLILTMTIAIGPALLYSRVPARWTLLVPAVTLTGGLATSLMLLKVFRIWFPPSATLLTVAASYPLWSWWQLRKLALYQRSLAEAQQRALATLHSVGEAVIVADAEGCVQDMNPSAENLTGYRLAEARGRPMNEVVRIVDESTREIMTLPAGQAMQRGSITRLPSESLLISRSGDSFAVRASCVPIDGDENRCRGMVLAVADVTHAKEIAERLAFQATHDPLTRLPNRSLLEDRLQRAIARANRSRSSLAVLFVDLDEFKTVNDAFGHAAGDELLTAVAMRLNELLREDDTIARLSGDEFVIIGERVADNAAVLRIAERVRAALQPSFRIAGHEFPITCSIGVAQYPDDGRDADTLIRHADSAMYRAKQQGRNRIVQCWHDAGLSSRDRLDTIREMMTAVRNDEFELFFQPQVEIDQGRVVGVEALLRWHHPKRGLLEPASFIRAAEAVSHSVALDEWVIRSACRQHVTWRQSSIHPGRIAINLSAKQLSDPTIIDMLDQVVVGSGADPSEIEIEITERSIMRDLGLAGEIARDIKKRGFSFAIDDFGTGFSSFSYVVNFPIDRIKIDRSFVRSLLSDPGSEAIVTAVISMAHGLNKVVLAEGVETEAELNWLRAKGCDEAQGFLFGRPMPAKTIASLLRLGRIRPGATSA